MPDLYQVRIQAINGKCLSCHVIALRDSDGYRLASSRTLALGFLWNTTDWSWWMRRGPNDAALTKENLEALAASTPLGRELAQHDLWSFDGKLWQSNAERCISCVGVVDCLNCDRGPDEATPLEEYPQATYHIAVSDPRWLEHLRPGMEWGSRVWNMDRSPVCDVAWRTSDVLALARGIDDSSAFDRLPILADALQDGRCEDHQLLGHCRGPGPHVRGCWAINLVLGRE